MRNEPHEPGSGWQCAAFVLAAWAVVKWVAFVFAVLWCVGQLWGLVCANPVIR